MNKMFIDEIKTIKTRALNHSKILAFQSNFWDTSHDFTLVFLTVALSKNY